MASELFKAYDIRGIYPAEISEDFAYRLGRAAATHFAGEDVVIGRDGRTGSDKLSAALIKGITEQGSNAVDIGICSTPMVYFAAQERPAIMVTASHNPKEYNGFKICAKGGLPLSFPDGLSAIKEIVERAKFDKPKRKGKARTRNILAQYVKHVRQFKGKLRKLKVVMDAGNGVQGSIAPKVFARLPVKIIPLFFEPDGSFPNRSPNPILPGALSALSKAVREHKADCGIAFDGDGDRVVFVDERGAACRPDHVLVLFAQHLLELRPHAKILYDLRSSRIAKEKITESGGVAIMTRVGHSFITHIMKEEDAVLAGEQSGHYYFRENFCADSGDIPALLMMNVLSRKKPLSKLLAPLHKYANSGELNFTVAHAAQAMKKAEEAYAGKGRAYHLDGLSVEFPDWWFNLRASHTEPVLRLNVEASTKALLERKVAELKRLLQ